MNKDNDLGRIFEGFNQRPHQICPICRTDVDKPFLLVPIPGTKDGDRQEAQQIHFYCCLIVQLSLKLTQQQEPEAFEKAFDSGKVGG